MVTRKRHLWKADPGMETVLVCSRCGLVKCEAWYGSNMLPTIEYSDRDGEVLSRGTPTKTLVPPCSEGRYRQ